MNLTIYMKSGNNIELDNVKSWEVDGNGDSITRLKLKQTVRHWWFRRSRYLILSSIDLSQIEAIVQH